MTEAFGTLGDGRQVDRITLTAGDLTVRLLTLGAIVQDVRLAGVDHGLTLGSDDLAAYEGPMNYFGAIVGPVANRIGGARAMIGGREFRFPVNEGQSTTLHGGPMGTHARIWTLEDHHRDSATLSLTLPDGEEGYPGTRRIRATFRIEEPARMVLDLTATSDAPTLMNLANHGYWNLGPEPTTEGHRMIIAADRYTPVDHAQIPVGTAKVEGTPFDFRKGRVLADNRADHYDHNFCLADARREPTFAAELTGPTGITMRIETTEPGLQVYDASRLSTAPFAGHGGARYGAFAGLAIEAQGWPDACNQPGFPDISLAPGQTYRQITQWAFSKG